jgi:hypothetical protein
LAGIQFSGSPSFHGEKKTNIKNKHRALKFKKSFEVKKGLNLTRRLLSLDVRGLVLPVSCKKIKCTKTNARTAKGRR